MEKKHLLITTIAILGLAIMTNGQTIPSYVPTNGLIGWWPFNANANDESGNNNNGTNNGATLTTDRFGHADSAYLFDGTSSFISIPSSASLESPTTRISFSAWVNLAGYSLVGQTLDPILVKSNSTANNFMYRFEIDLNGTGFYAGTNDWTNNIGAPYNFPLNQWNMVSEVLDSSTAYIYLDDTLIATQPFTTNILNNTLPLEIGIDMPGITEVFNGKIDDIGIWNRALTHQEISNLYTGVNVGIAEPLTGSPSIMYPNPAANQLNILVNESDVGSSYIIRDEMGKSILTGKLTSKNSLISLSNLSSGIYLLTIGEYTKQTFHFIKN